MAQDSGSDFIFTSDITVNFIDKMGDDARIAMAAWASRDLQEGIKRANEHPENIPGVINYLLKHRHGTPFEASACQFTVHAPIFVWREWHRHRIGFSYNEESGRYTQLKPCFYIPPRDRPMMKIENWKPGRPKFLECNVNSIYETLNINLKESYRLAYKNYESNLALGIDPGLARDCLPVGIYSSCWVTTNVRAIMHFLSLRTHDENAKFVSYPLYEIEVAARKVEEILKTYWPISYDAFIKNGRVSP